MSRENVRGKMTCFAGVRTEIQRYYHEKALGRSKRCRMVQMHTNSMTSTKICRHRDSCLQEQPTRLCKSSLVFFWVSAISKNSLDDLMSEHP
jgi:hypothetical protein